MSSVSSIGSPVNALVPTDLNQSAADSNNVVRVAQEVILKSNESASSVPVFEFASKAKVWIPYNNNELIEKFLAEARNLNERLDSKDKFDIPTDQLNALIAEIKAADDVQDRIGSMNTFEACIEKLHGLMRMAVKKI